MKVKKKKSGQKTYLNEDEESLLAASGKIEGDNCLPLDWRGVKQQLQNSIKAIKSWCGDYDTQEKSSLRYCR